jgi:hypothetical protein
MGLKDGFRVLMVNEALSFKNPARKSTGPCANRSGEDGPDTRTSTAQFALAELQKSRAAHPCKKYLLLDIARVERRVI